MAREGVAEGVPPDFAARLAHYGPRLPLPQLVYEVNRLFHAEEARVYDGSHEEFAEQVPRLWREMIELARASAPGSRWSVLDFGCGTGFASELLVKHLTPAAIEHLTCFDPSPEMLARCRRKVASLGDRVRFVGDAAELAASGRRYNLIASNSVLHHLPDPLTTADGWARLAAPGAFWLAGHEPSRRYHGNPACRAMYAEFVRWRKHRQRWSPRRWLRRLIGLVRPWHSSARHAAGEAYRRGWFASRPNGRLISRLVDFHVPHDGDANSGFDLEAMKTRLRDVWNLTWVKTYGFMGRFYEGGLPACWARAASQLADQYPLDGAHFCAVWQHAHR